MCWAWNLQGGWLRAFGFIDRGGSVIIFYCGALAGIIGSVVLGPRYGRFLKKTEREKIRKLTENKTPLSNLLDDVKNDAVEIDE